MGGLALINVELKIRALYLKTNLFEKVDEINGTKWIPIWKEISCTSPEIQNLL
jgi:hypothetical protein